MKRAGAAKQGKAAVATRKQGKAATAAVDPARVRQLCARLADAIPEPRCELRHDDAFQLLVATILSAQSTDARVNQVTPALFAAYPTPKALAGAELPAVENLVRSTGFFRNKAKAIVAASRILQAEHGGQVPRSLAALIALPGVARKTANVVLGTAYRLPTGVVVDTHVGRVTRRLGLTAQADPERVEAELCALLPKDAWIDTGHRLVLHGRYLCRAKKPACAACPLAELCPSAEAKPQETPAARARAERLLIERAPV